MAYAYLRSLRPRQVEAGGEWRIVDSHDGPLRSLVALWAVLFGSHVAYKLVADLWHSPGTDPVSTVLMLVAAAGLYALLLWTEGRRLLEAVYARPGELFVSEWPLQAGEPVLVTYRRRFRLGHPSGEVKPRLVFWSKRRRQHQDHVHQYWQHVRSHEIPIEGGDASFENGELVATWQFTVPTWGRDQAPLTGRRMIIAEMLGLYRHMDYWELQVDMTVGKHLRLDSRLKLDIDFRASVAQTFEQFGG